MRGIDCDQALVNRNFDLLRNFGTAGQSRAYWIFWPTCNTQSFRFQKWIISLMTSWESILSFSLSIGISPDFFSIIIITSNPCKSKEVCVKPLRCLGKQVGSKRLKVHYFWEVPSITGFYFFHRHTFSDDWLHLLCRCTSQQTEKDIVCTTPMWLFLQFSIQFLSQSMEPIS